MSGLKKINRKVEEIANPFAGIEPEERRAKIWDHEHGRWVNLTEEEIEKRWPKKK